MPRKRFTAEQIITKLREAEVELAKGPRAIPRGRCAGSWGSDSRPTTSGGGNTAG
jgi:hypothetical protein